MGTLTEIASSDFNALQIDVPKPNVLSTKNIRISVTIDSMCHAYHNENNLSVLAYLTFMNV